MTSNTVDNVCEDIIDGILSGEIDRDNLENKKLHYCGKYNASRVPKNSTILKSAEEKTREKIKKVLQVAPVRSSSGVTPITVMTHPVSVCPHGRCHFCPAGEESQFDNTQLSYPGGPSVMRAQSENYDPYGQVTRRLSQLHRNGHDVDKTDLIIKSATFTSRSHDYQVWFVKRCLEAMNDYDTTSFPEQIDNKTFAQDSYDFKYVENVIRENEEESDVKCIGITLETKPDWCNIEQINRLLSLGGTKVEIGVQTTFDEVNKRMHRGHGQEESKRANKQLRDAGFKVGFHMMPGLPGMDRDMILEDFDRIFTGNDWKPDYLKIYPCLVVSGTVVYDMWRKGNFEPLDSEEAAEIIARVKEKIPKYVRLQRVQRDIPADQIEAGVQKSNLRQLAQHKLEGDCDCIRCREVGLRDDAINSSSIVKDVMSYKACEGIEKFISFEDSNSNQLVGFARLRLPFETHREELSESTILRELHVYGNQVSIGEEKAQDWQHKGYGQRLMKEAENISIENGYEKISVISGIGARKYYKDKLDYQQDGPYVSKEF